MPLTYLDRTADTDTVAAVLRRDGAVAVNSLADPELADTIVSELRPELDAFGLDNPSDFGGDRTRRIKNVLTVAPSAARLMEHDMVVGVADDILLPNCATYQIGSTDAIEVLPGQSAQALHRDDTTYPIEMAGMELQIGVMWALDDFSMENGGTRVVVGSHRFIRSWHLPDLSGWEAAVMPKGSALFYLGSIWHGAGENLSNAPRAGLVTTYSLGWLRQEYNQYLYNPPEVAARFGPRLKALLGYTPHGSGDDRLGTFGGDCPAWIETPPEPTWQDNRGRGATAADVEAQAGV